MSYVPHTPAEQQAMLSAIGLESMDDLFASVPESIRLGRPLDIPAKLTEHEILSEFDRLAAKNRTGLSFLGAGCYRRFIPAAVDYLASRGEFNTSYTPYQPEVSQGTLQAIFEYQSMICRLTAMDISNASMYEGATAVAEAALMSYSVRRDGNQILVSDGVHPEYRKVLATYLESHPLEIVPVPLTDGGTSAETVARRITRDVLAVVVQSPNFFGSIEDGKGIRAALDQVETPPFLIAVVDPISLAVLAPPGDYGADIAVGEGQQLGNYPAYGGPSFGFFTTRQKHVRKLPGRIVGETLDRDGKRGYVLTFQTREQHIRRERATSNICTNQGLCCLRGAMYLALLGESGLRAVASASARKAHHAHRRLTRIPGVESVSGRPFFSEFALRLPRSAAEVYTALGEIGIGGGLPLDSYFPDRGREMLLAFTELHTTKDIEALASALESICR